MMNYYFYDAITFYYTPSGVSECAEFKSAIGKQMLKVMEESSYGGLCYTIMYAI